ncbi:type II toxin-antitoxin system HigB family toxin [Algoriphagus boritolerans]|uniref:type II toxin-antitoxin system HigB family toxin n=1 Tax=Algoriphagus boritolerans TaxID=308111 RepID=UPI002FCE5FF4
MLVDFVRSHPDSRSSLEKWKETVKSLKLTNLNQIKEYFRSADILPKNRIVFNISGNKYRLITGIHLAQPGKQDIVFTIWIGTHAEYDKIDANKI